MSDTFDEEENRSTEAVPVPWGSSGGFSLDDFDPESFDVSGAPSATDAEDAATKDDDPFSHLTTGTELGGRYKLEKILGRGACGVVFRASHMVIGKKVAVKCLYPMLRSHPVLVERFFREARIAAAVDHPNVIKIFDGGDDAETLFLAMELLHGETLGERLERGRLALQEARELFLKIAEGLAAMHERGVVHRDLKPDNVFLTVGDDGRPGEPKVLDFGISKLKEPGRNDLTALGTIMGTPFYMAPEQMMNAKGVDRRADVYSLGVMLYEALSGQLPYNGENVADIFSAARSASCPALGDLAPHVSPEITAIVAKAMQVEPGGRHTSVDEMRAALEAATWGSGLDENATLEQLAPPARAQLPTPKPPPVFEEASPSQIDNFQTRVLARPPVAEPALPGWAILAMVALALLALASIAVAIVAILI